MSNNNIPPGSKEAWVSDSDEGTDLNVGDSPNFPKRTLNGAIDYAVSLGPSLGDPAILIDVGASTYPENLDIPDNVFCNLPVSRLTPETGTAVLAGANATLWCLTIQPQEAGATAYDTDGNSRLGLVTPSVILTQDNQTGVAVTGASNEFFTTVSQLFVLAGTDGCTAVDITNSGGPGSMVLNEIDLEGNNGTGIRYAATHGGITDIRGGAIRDFGTGNLGIDVVSGEVSIFKSVVEAGATVRNGGILNMFDASLDGDFTVEAGGQAFVEILKHTNGSVFNAGLICGRIGDVYYNCSADGSTIIVAFNRRGIIPLSPVNIGRLTIDTTNDTVTEIIGSYQQNSGGSRTVNFVVEDADTPSTKYFEGSLTDTGSGTKFVTLAANDPLPVNSVVNLNFTVDRDGVGAGVVDPSIQFEFERV